MNTALIKMFAVVSTILFSTLSFAGENCDMHEGIHKDMSAEALKEFKENHIWLLDEDTANLDKSGRSNDLPDPHKPAKAVNDKLVEI